jgi:hypothetical protein
MHKGAHHKLLNLSRSHLLLDLLDRRRDALPGHYLYICKLHYT